MKEKLSLLTELIKLAQCDQKVREQEYEFLLTIARSFDVSKDDFDALFIKYIEFIRVLNWGHEWFVSRACLKHNL